MKILMVSMNSIHFTRWTQQLENSGHEVYWFNVYDSGYNESLPWVQQFYGWKKRFGDFRGRLFLKKYLPSKLFSMLFEKDITEAFEKVLTEVKPDCVHSFAYQVSVVPIWSVMEKYQSIKMVYSSWGSDVFFRKELGFDDENYAKFVSKLDFLFTDCKRDYNLLGDIGFRGVYLGDFPGNGGLKICENLNQSKKYIFIKCYQDSMIGRGDNIIKALTNDKLLPLISNFTLVFLGVELSGEQLINTSNIKNQSIIIKKSNPITNIEVLTLLSESLIYIGNSLSDGIPNMMLEAMSVGAFPIQSNPGGVTEELIQHKTNGLLIQNPDDVEEIKHLIYESITNKQLIKEGVEINLTILKEKYNRELLQQIILEKYELIEKNRS